MPLLFYIMIPLMPLCFTRLCRNQMLEGNKHDCIHMINLRQPLLYSFIILVISFIVYCIFKNVSSSTSHKKSLSVFTLILLSTFIYELILIKKKLNGNTLTTQIFHWTSKDIEGHIRSLLCLKIYLCKIWILSII